jgi:hypothetical protein
MIAPARSGPGPPPSLMHWLTNYGFDFHLVDWLALATVFALILTVRIGALRLIFRLFKHKRDTGQGESEYWRRHGG